MDSEEEVQGGARRAGITLWDTAATYGVKRGSPRPPSETHRPLEEIASSFSVLHANTRITLPRPFCDT